MLGSGRMMEKRWTAKNATRDPRDCACLVVFDSKVACSYLILSCSFSTNRTQLATKRSTTMTLDITSFIDSKGGNAEEIRESQRKRGHSVELVDEIIRMYTDWVKSTRCSRSAVPREQLTSCISVDFDANALRKKINEVQKEIAAKKKV